MEGICGYAQSDRRSAAAKMFVAPSEVVALKFKCMETLRRLRISEDDKAGVAEFVEAYVNLNKAEQAESLTKPQMRSFLIHVGTIEAKDAVSLLEKDRAT